MCCMLGVLLLCRRAGERRCPQLQARAPWLPGFELASGRRHFHARTGAGAGQRESVLGVRRVAKHGRLAGSPGGRVRQRAHLSPQK